MLLGRLGGLVPPLADFARPLLGSLALFEPRPAWGLALLGVFAAGACPPLLLPPVTTPTTPPTTPTTPPIAPPKHAANRACGLVALARAFLNALHEPLRVRRCEAPRASKAMAPSMKRSRDGTRAICLGLVIIWSPWSIEKLGEGQFLSRRGILRCPNYRFRPEPVHHCAALSTARKTLPRERVAHTV